MTDRTTRRRLLVTVGAGAAAAIAGCSGSSNDTENNSTTATTTQTTSKPTTTATETTNTSGGDASTGPRQGDDLPSDPNPADGYPPEFDATLSDREVDPSSFDVITRHEVDVKLVPIDVAYYWYVNGDARFVDARSKSEYDTSHVLGAVNSPAGNEKVEGDDPESSWPKSDRIVAYCACPHHLSSLRASTLQKNGYEEVYAIDEGYTEWRNRDYPMSGSEPTKQPDVKTIRGEAPKKFAGKTAWAYDTTSDQKEATTIGKDGSYELELKFVDVDANTKIRVKTPAYEVTAKLSALTSGGVTKDGTVGDSTNSLFSPFR